MLPTFFVSHGAPTFPLEVGTATHSFMQGLLTGLKPRAILVISAHWEEDEATTTAVTKPETMHDFTGFPKALYDLRYNPPGDFALADRAATILERAGIPAGMSKTRGIDHGCWTPLILAAPKADIPVVQLSLLQSLDASIHLEMGRRLAPLRADGVLIIGSGGAVHNLHKLNWEGVITSGVAASEAPPKWAADFQGWLDAALAKPGAQRSNELERWASAPFAREAHPREEHLLPLHVATGAAENAAAVKIHSAWQMGAMSLAAYRFG